MPISNSTRPAAQRPLKFSRAIPLAVYSRATTRFRTHCSSISASSASYGGGNVLTVDYVRNHGVGVPIMLYDAEQRHDASTLNKTAAQSKINGVLGGLTVDQWIAANPTKTISSFGLGGDTIFTGLSSQLLRNRNRGGADSRFIRRFKPSLRGRLANKAWIARNMSYIVSYAYGSSKDTCGVGRGEFEAGSCNNRDVLNKAYFGPNAFDIRHNFSAGVCSGY